MSKSYKEMNEHEKMLAGLPYHAYRDGLPEMRMACKIRLRQFNTCPPEDLKEQDRLIREIMGSVGEHIEIFPPFYCDYGKIFTSVMDFLPVTTVPWWTAGP